MELPGKREERRARAHKAIETRLALLDATIRVVYRCGYSRATIASIAADAGVSRGAITYHFRNRATLMADVVSYVFELEHEQYARMYAGSRRGERASDWPDMLWEMFSQPSGLAALEILHASRSDPVLADRVKTVQQAIEDLFVLRRVSRYGLPPDPDSMRLVAWAIRGLTIAQPLMRDPAEIRGALRRLRLLIETAERHDVAQDLDST